MRPRAARSATPGAPPTTASSATWPAEYGGLFVDAGTPLLRKARALFKQSPAHTIYSDGGHFNPVGNLIIAAEVLRALGIELAG